MHRGIRNSFMRKREGESNAFYNSMHDENIIMKTEQMYNKMIMKSTQWLSSCKFYKCVNGRGCTSVNKRDIHKNFSLDTIRDAEWIRWSSLRQSMTTTTTNNGNNHSKFNKNFSSVWSHKYSSNTLSKNAKWISPRNVKNQILHLLFMCLWVSVKFNAIVRTGSHWCHAVTFRCGFLMLLHIAYPIIYTARIFSFYEWHWVVLVRWTTTHY